MSKFHPNSEETLILSPRWSAPELFKDRLLSFETDIWALGCVYTELFNAGKKPYHGWATEKLRAYMQKDNGTRPGILYDNCPADFRKLLDRMFDYNPESKNEYCFRIVIYLRPTNCEESVW